MDEDNMPKLTDRKRVKDRIIEGIAKAVKHIQSYYFSQVSTEENVIVLKNSDWQLHKLVENLDHVFLYGLRHFSNGYWIIVQEFTHKSTISDINKMTNITTNLGRSRAWLYMALVDHLLESYILCFMKNADLVRKYYVKEAFVLDEQRLQLLLTLSSGLDLISFDLEVDVQYLDLCSYLKVRTDSQEDEEEDDLSLCSMISSQSQGSSMEESNLSHLKISTLSIFTNLIKPLTLKTSESSSSSLTAEETEDEKKLRIESFVTTKAVASVTCQSLEESQDGTNEMEIEVIHEKVKRHGRKKDRHQQKPASAPASDNISLVSVDSSASLLSPLSSESSGYRSVPEDTSSTLCADDKPIILVSDSCNFTVMDTICNAPEVNEEREQRPKETREKLTEEERLQRILNECCDVTVSDKKQPFEISFNKTIEWNCNAHLPLQQMESPSKTRSVRSRSLCSSPIHVQTSFPVSCEEISSKAADVNDGAFKSLVVSIEEPSIYDESGSLLQAAAVDRGVKRHSFAAHHTELVEVVEPAVVATHVKQVQTAQEVVPRERTEKKDVTRNSVKTVTGTKQADYIPLDTKHTADIEVDNNMKLVLMLEVFLHEEETFLKMFRTCQGHTYGEISVVYVVLTSHSIYILKPGRIPNKFVRDAAIGLQELDYVSISLNYQILHIVCHKRRNQFWVTTGDEILTRLILSHLDRAVSQYSSSCSSSPPLSSLTVLTDCMAQKISITKWASTETGLEREDVSILNYSLVYWEDSEAIINGDVRLNSSREGVLFYKQNSNSTAGSVYNLVFTGASWSRAYFVLEQGILNQYADKKCSGTPVQSISLSPDQCHGCRRSPHSDRKHCFEILLADGSSLELSAASDAELQDWIIGLCQATCDQTAASSFGCVTCCSVVTQSHVLMCHEDLQTNFMRTLGSLSLSNLSQIQTDGDVTTYCILVFKRQLNLHVQHEKWCIYFGNNAEQEKFIAAILEACTTMQQENLQISSVDDKMSTRCHRGIIKLKQLRGEPVAV